uniref:Uncharacterized protein n=1 Tax=Amphimedon queenslandica TaxID=400682 RepID=A0A1X7UJD0_AMPQE
MHVGHINNHKHTFYLQFSVASLIQDDSYQCC